MPLLAFLRSLPVWIGVGRSRSCRCGIASAGAGRGDDLLGLPFLLLFLFIPLALRPVLLDVIHLLLVGEGGVGV